MGDMHVDAVITLEETRDPRTGEIVFAKPGEVLQMTDSGLLPERSPAAPVELPRDRFAGEERGVDWAAAERQQANGLVVSMVDGQLVTGAGPEAKPIALPEDRFAAPIDTRFREENQAVLALSQAGAASVVSLLKHSSQFPSWPASSTIGWVYTTRPTAHGDQLTVLIAFNGSTGLYHAHFWRYDVRGVDGRMGAVDLPAYLNQHPNLTAHRAHMYPDVRGGAVLCLSTATRGGLPSLSAAVLQAAKWADGMGEVVRGRAFPYRQ